MTAPFLLMEPALRDLESELDGLNQPVIGRDVIFFAMSTSFATP